MSHVSRSPALVAGVLVATAAGAVALWQGSATAKLPKSIEIATTPDNVVYGHFPIGMPPVVTVQSGDLVKSNCVSSSGIGDPNVSPTAYFGALGVPPEEVLPDLTEIWANEPRPNQHGPHILTGPIYVEGAEPGDTLEIRILDFEFRVPYGVNTTTARGVLSSRIPPGTARLLRIDPREKVMLFDADVHVPLKPFMGTMGVAPADDYVSPLPSAAAAGIVSSVPPGPFGGNMDLNDLSVGTSLYLPVFQPGAQFFSGDCHGVQGNGEIDGTALEQSLAVTYQFILHKDGNLKGPRAETPTHYIAMGIDVDLDVAMRLSVMDAIDFLGTEKGYSKADAYSVTSLAVDFNIAEAVDYTQLVQGRIPKRFFADYGKKPRFWHHTPPRSANELIRTGHDAVR